MKKINMRDALSGITRRPDWVSHVTPSSLRADAFAGLTGATIVLPQGVAFAAIAGLPPEYGIYTAMITPIVAAIFGSSWHAVSGPTTAMSALVFGALSGLYEPGSGDFINAAIVLALLVGVFQLMMGLVRLGGIIDFVSHSVMVGFVTGAALLIALSQLPVSLGLEVQKSEHLIDFIRAAWQALDTLDPKATLIAATSLSLAFLIRLWSPLAPNYLLALAGGTALNLWLFSEGDVHTVGDLGSILPAFHLPYITGGHIRDLTSAAIAIGIVGLLQAASISRALAQKSDQMIDGNREFVGQGLSNAVGSLFQCYPGSASFTRSGVNYEAGAKTPLSAIFAAVFLLLILLLVGSWFAYVPVSAIAGVILLVAWRLIDFKAIWHIFETSRIETLIVVATFMSSLFISLEFSIYAGVMISLMVFLNKTAHPVVGVGAPDPSKSQRMFRNAQIFDLAECPQLVFARLDGPLYFGSVEFIRRAFRQLEQTRPAQKHLLFITKGTGEMDMAGAELLIEEAARRDKNGGSFLLQVKSPFAMQKLTRYRVLKALTKEHIFLSKHDAIAQIVPRLDPEICRSCRARIFRECAGRPMAIAAKGSTGTPDDTGKDA